MLGLKSPDLNLSRISRHVQRSFNQIPVTSWIVISFRVTATCRGVEFEVEGPTEIGEFGVPRHSQVSLSPVWPLIGDYAFGMMQRETGTHRWPAIEI